MNINKAQLEFLASEVFKNLGRSESSYSPDNNTLEEQILIEAAGMVSELLRQSLIDKKGTATRQLLQSIDVGDSRKTGHIVTVPVEGEDYWKYFEEGRRPGKMPPIKSIEEWITAQGIKVRQSRQQATSSVLKMRTSMAWAIARKIAKKGTIARFGYKGSKFVEEALNPTTIEAISDVMIRKYGEKLAVYVTWGDSQNR